MFRILDTNAPIFHINLYLFLVTGIFLLNDLSIDFNPFAMNMGEFDCILDDIEDNLLKSLPVKFHRDSLDPLELCLYRQLFAFTVTANKLQNFNDGFLW